MAGTSDNCWAIGSRKARSASPLTGTAKTPAARVVGRQGHGMHDANLTISVLSERTASNAKELSR
jgi:hypothetical protein